MAKGSDKLIGDEIVGVPMIVPGPVAPKRRPFGAKTAKTRNAMKGLKKLDGKPLPKGEKSRQLLMQHLAGASVADLARAYGMNPGTVHNLLSAQQRKIYVAVGKDNVLTRLTAKALAALEMNLDAGDKEVALRVLEDVGIIAPEGSRSGLADGEESFEIFRAKLIRKSAGEIVGGKPGQVMLEDELPINAEFVEEMKDEQQSDRTGGEGAGDAGVRDGGSSRDQHRDGEGSLNGDALLPSAGDRPASDLPQVWGGFRSVDAPAGPIVDPVGDDEEGWVR